MKKLVIVTILALLGLSTVVLAGQYSEGVLGTDPVAYFRFNNATAASGDALVNQGTGGAALNGTWGDVNASPCALPAAGQPGPTPSATAAGGYNQTVSATALLGMDADNKAAGFRGDNADAGGVSNSDQFRLGSGPAQVAAYNASTMTLSMWFRQSTDYMSAGMFIGVPDQTGAPALFVATYTNALTIGIGTNTPNTTGASCYSQYTHNELLYAPKDVTQQWHNLVIVRTGDSASDNITVYIDGADQDWYNTCTWDYWTSYSSAAVTGSGRIGSFDNNPASGWQSFGNSGTAPSVGATPENYGQIDEVAVWGKALTADDVAALWASATSDAKANRYVNGDTDRNAVIDGIDLATLAQNWDPLGATQRRWAQGDFNGDGVIDGVDLAALAQGWAPLGYTGGAVPEPATLSLLVLGGLAALRRRK